MSTRDPTPFHHSQNNFPSTSPKSPKATASNPQTGNVTKSSAKATASLPSPTKEAKRAIINLKHHNSRPSKPKIDRFGRALNNPSSSLSDWENVSNPKPKPMKSSAGNPFAPVQMWSSDQQKDLKGGRGIKYTLAVLLTALVCFTAYVYPRHLPLLYCVTIVPLFIFRFVSFYILARHHFCLEVCYFINYAVMTYILILPDNTELFMGAFVLAQAIGLGSTVVLSHRLIFHDIQTYINAYMHVMPALVTFVIRFVIDLERDHDDPFPLINFSFKVCKMTPSSINEPSCSERVKDYLTSLRFLFVLPIAAYGAHMLLYNIWVFAVPHKNLRLRRTYCNTLVQMMSGGFGDHWPRLITSLGGRRWKIWVYSAAQLVWAAAFMAAAGPLYYSDVATGAFIAVCVLLMVVNGGTFHSHQARKLVAATEQLQVYEEKEEKNTTNSYLTILQGEAEEDDGEEKKDDRGDEGQSQMNVGTKREVATIIRSVDAFTYKTTDYGRSHRAKMSSKAANGKRVMVTKHTRERDGDTGDIEAGDDRDTEENVGALAMIRRAEAKSSTRPSVF
jgi:hypothetical protein